MVLRKTLRSMSKKQLCQEFKISASQLRLWIKEHDAELGLKKRARILCPRQIRILFKYYGPPEGFDKIDDNNDD